MRRIDEAEFARARPCFRTRLQTVDNAEGGHIELVVEKRCYGNEKENEYCFLVYFLVPGNANLLE